MGDMRNVYKFLDEKSDLKRQLVRLGVEMRIILKWALRN
jgi:hypothetical protein